MRFLEYEAKQVFKKYGMNVPRGRVAETPEEAAEIALELGCPVAIKAQIPVGGRGKAGGIKFAETPEEVWKKAEKLLNSEIRGIKVRRILVEEKLEIERELYFGITVDRSARVYVAIASSEGGVEIEEVALEKPEAIFKHYIDPFKGFRTYHARSLARKIGYSGEKAAKLVDTFMKLYKVAMDYDVELTEINPLVELAEGEFMVADARLIVDDNALYRHPELEYKRVEESSRETLAKKLGLSYVELDGNVGVIGNGAGLVMATLDLINLYGGKPANFLDVGGGASPEVMASALEVVLSNPKVKVVLINILGGITRCDDIAMGIIEALDKIEKKPMVIRLVGTKEKEGRKILEEAGIEVLDNMEKAAKRAVEIARVA